MLYVLAWVALALFTLICFGTALVDYAAITPTFDAVVSATTIVLAGSVVVRTWVRFADGGGNDTLFQSAAFLVLFVGGVLRLVLVLGDNPLAAGYRLDEPGQGPLYVWTLQRFSAAVLLLFGAIAVLRSWPRIGRRWQLAIMLGPAIVLAALIGLLLTNESALPEIIPGDLLVKLLRPEQTIDPGLIGTDYAAIQLAIAAVFTISSLAYARLATTRGWRTETSFLAVALAIAAFSELHYAIVPGTYEGLLTSGDYLRLGFYIAVLAGAALGGLHDLRELRQANAELAELRRTEAERIAITERARLARDIHDGIAQELWLARLTAGRLSESADLAADDRQTVERLDGILDRALAEARQAIVTLQPMDDEGFAELLRRYVDDYGDHFGMEIECSVDANVSPSTHQQAELLRICREALNNARKHADSSVVRVRLSSDNEGIVMTIADNGRGFDPEHVRAGFGLQSMHQRAESLGGQLVVESAPLDGTRVTVRVPPAADA